MSILASMRELRVRLNDVAEVDWRHPAWWGLLAGTAILERFPAPKDPDIAYVTSNGGPRSDTFMAREIRRSHLGDTIVRAVLQARAAVTTLIDLHGDFPEQPLLCELDARSTLVRRRPIENPSRVAFCTPAGIFSADLPADVNADGVLIAELASAYSDRQASFTLLRRVDRRETAPVGAAIAVSLYGEEISSARHLHRRCWTAGGGPWLGLGFTGNHELVTTSHTVIDGYGHAQVARRIFAAGDWARGCRSKLFAEAPRCVDAGIVAGPRLAMANPLGVASCILDTSRRFPEMVRALALTMEQYYRADWSETARRRAQFTPTLHIPIAPGRRDDLARFRRRVVPGLFSLRMRDGEVETLEGVRTRLPGAIARESTSMGALTRMSRALVRGPIPNRFVREGLERGASPTQWIPPMEVLAGRGCLSVLRFGPGDRPASPLMAVSSPALNPSALDPRGSTVLTIVESDRGVCLTVSGTGLAGSAAGAGRFLSGFVGHLRGA